VVAPKPTSIVPTTDGVMKTCPSQTAWNISKGDSGFFERNFVEVLQIRALSTTLLK
jgi:hypothetical protein